MDSSEAMVSREPIKNQVASIIKEKILTGVIVPGQRIVPGDFAVSLNTGRGAIREALIQLEAEGLVKNIPYRGCYATVMNMDEMYEISSLRALLESYAIDNMDEEITAEDFQALEQIIEKMQIAVDQLQYNDIVKYDSQFHGYFVKKVSKGLLFKTWDMTNAKLAAMFFYMLNRGFPFSQIANNHRALVTLLSTSTGEYKQLLHEHYMRLPDYFHPEEDADEE